MASDRKSKFLVVDDDAAIRTLLWLSLALEGFSIVEACEGAEALARRTDDVDALITDLTMPYMDGVELISRAQQP